MTEDRCRWNSEAADYLTPDGEPCKRDSYGDPTKHCTAKRSCSQHVGPRDQTCARCVNDVRTNLRWIPDLTPLVMVEALDDGVNSEAAMLAGPAADPRTFSDRRTLDRRWLYERIPTRNLARAIEALLPDDDPTHPFNVLTRIHWDVSLAYGDDLPEVFTTVGSAAYIDRNLNRIAQDPDMEFTKVRSQIRKVREHLESVIHNSRTGQIGESCPTCVQSGKANPKHVRLRREFGHWVYEGEEKGWRLKYSTNPSEDDEAEPLDRWVCPREQGHHWDDETYRNWVEERKGGRSAG